MAEPVMCCGGTCVRALCEYHKDVALGVEEPEPPTEPRTGRARVFLVQGVSPLGKTVVLDDGNLVPAASLRYPDGSRPTFAFSPGDMVVMP